MPFYKVTQRPQYFASRYLVESESGVVLCGAESIDYANHIVGALNAYIPPPVCQHDPFKEHCTLRTYLPIPGEIACIACKKKWLLFAVGADFKC